MHFTFTFRRGPEVVAKIVGKELDPNAISIAEMQEVIPLEQKLEKWLGTRVHIDLEYDLSGRDRKTIEVPDNQLRGESK